MHGLLNGDDQKTMVYMFQSIGFGVHVTADYLIKHVILCCLHHHLDNLIKPKIKSKRLIKEILPVKTFKNMSFKQRLYLKYEIPVINI